MQYVFGHDPGAPRLARSLLSGWLAEPEEVLSDDVHLVASEMVTSVVMHTNAGGVRRVWDLSPLVPLRLEVEDSGPTPRCTCGRRVTAGSG